MLSSIHIKDVASFDKSYAEVISGLKQISFMVAMVLGKRPSQTSFLEKSPKNFRHVRLYGLIQHH